MQISNAYIEHKSCATNVFQSNLKNHTYPTTAAIFPQYTSQEYGLLKSCSDHARLLSRQKRL